MRSRRPGSGNKLRVLVVAMCAALAFPASAMADADTGTPPPVGFHLTFKTPLRLTSTMAGTIRSDRPTDLFHADVSIAVAGRSYFATSVDGTSKTTATSFTFRVPKASRTLIAREAHRRHRRAVLVIGVAGKLQGDSVTSIGTLRRPMTLPGG